MARTRKEETVRPYRLWDSKKKQDLRWRYYSDHVRAHNAALIEVRWAKIDEVIEVYNCLSGRLLGTYKRNLNSISYTKG